MERSGWIALHSGNASGLVSRKYGELAPTTRASASTEPSSSLCPVGTSEGITAASRVCSSPTISPIRVESDVNDALVGLSSAIARYAAEPSRSARRVAQACRRTAGEGSDSMSVKRVGRVQA